MQLSDETERILSTLPLSMMLFENRMTTAEYNRVVGEIERLVQLAAREEPARDPHGHCESCGIAVGNGVTYRTDTEGVHECAKCMAEDAAREEGGGE